MTQTSTTNLNFDGPGLFSTNFGSCTYRYMALGLQAEWGNPISITIGIDFRHEILVYTITDVGGEAPYYGSSPIEATLLRPWGKVGLGYMVRRSVISPVFRLEYAKALIPSKEPLLDFWQMDVAPTSTLALSIGLRFGAF